MNAVAESPSLLRWRQGFAADPAAALDGLLTQSAFLGAYNRARPAEALRHLLRPDEIAQADAALSAWLQARLGQPAPEGLSAKRFADALVEAFRAVVLLPLPQTRAWCAARPAELRLWLRQFYFGASRDPETTLLVALAHGQQDRRLLPLWMGIVKRGRPEAQVRHALMGLGQMPADDNGAPERGLPKALLRGELEYAEALARSGDKKGVAWLEELDFLASVYPMSKDAWGRKFRDVLAGRKELSGPVRNWLDQRYPLAFKAGGERQGKGYLQPPHADSELKPLLPRIKTDYQAVRPQLQAFAERSRHYCRESGDSFYLVRSFCNLGDRLLDHDPLWARELAHEATLWAPSDPFAWSLLAKALEAEGDWRRAEAVLWHARRRFPFDVVRHTQLAHSMLLHGQAELGEAVYREAIRLFPQNPVCWADLANTLRTNGKREEAVQVYRQAQGIADFYRDPVLNTALADTLIDLGRLGEAEAALRWAEQVADPDDAKNQTKLEQIRLRLRRVQSGEVVRLKQLKFYEEKPAGPFSALADLTGADLAQAPGLGRAAVWRRQANGGLAKAADELHKLPASSARLIETGLLRAAERGWQEAAAWFDGHWERHAGEGVLRVHRLRAHARAGAAVDWAWERQLYPELLPVILTEERGEPPRPPGNAEDPNLSEEQRQEFWFADVASLPGLRDVAEEDFLTARRLA